MSNGGGKMNAGFFCFFFHQFGKYTIQNHNALTDFTMIF